MKIVGIVILVLIVLVVGGVLLARWLLRRALKRVMGTLADALIEAMRESALCAPPPPRVHLVPATDSPWDHETQAEESAGGLRTLGFEPGGVYEIAEVYGITLQVFTLTEERVYAVLYDHVQQGVWVDFVIRHEDDGVLTVSNVPLHDAVAPPWSRLVQDTEASLPELYQRLLSEAEDRPRRRVSAEDFPATFERSHAREMDWRNLRGGPTEEEIRRSAAGTGEEVTDDVVAATREQQAAAAAEGVTVLLKERFQAANP
ncbi:MAG: hypothetical protein FJX74_17025, partial [Armatimonadetes bacterium]|nr:hypothetical protein [Armatimonadota bacterium]